MADFKVGDTVRVRAGVKLWWPDDVPRDEIGTIESICEADGNAEIKFPSISFLFSAMLYDLELVSPAAPPQPDPRDAEIAALRQRVAELELRQDDDDWKYYRELVAAVIRRQDCPLGNVNAIAHDIFEEVKFREGGGDSSPERSRHENREKNLLVRGKSLLGG